MADNPPDHPKATDDQIRHLDELLLRPEGDDGLVAFLNDIGLTTRFGANYSIPAYLVQRRCFAHLQRLFQGDEPALTLARCDAMALEIIDSSAIILDESHFHVVCTIIDGFAMDLLSSVSSVSSFKRWMGMNRLLVDKHIRRQGTLYPNLAYLVMLDTPFEEDIKNICEDVIVRLNDYIHCADMFVACIPHISCPDLFNLVKALSNDRYMVIALLVISKRRHHHYPLIQLVTRYAQECAVDRQVPDIITYDGNGRLIAPAWTPPEFRLADDDAMNAWMWLIFGGRDLDDNVYRVIATSKFIPDFACDKCIPLIARVHQAGRRVSAKALTVPAMLLAASRQSDMNAAIALINAGVHVNMRDLSGWSAMHMLGDRNIGQCLLEHKADVNVRGERGRTPLHMVQNPDIARFLLDNHADVNARDDFDGTPLHYAVSVDIVDVLYDRHGDLFAVDVYGRMPGTNIIFPQEDAVVQRLQELRNNYVPRQ